MEWRILGDTRQSEEYLEVLQKKEVAVFEYYSEDGWKRFWRQELSEGTLLFQKTEEQPAFCRTELAGVSDFWIRCRIWKQEMFDRMRLSSIKLTSRNQGILPDTIYGAGEECNIHEYFPFGERLDLYSEVYFGCQEVLSKSGAQITLSFGIDFVRIPLDGEKKQIEWEWVMKKVISGRIWNLMSQLRLLSGNIITVPAGRGCFRKMAIRRFFLPKRE